MNSESSDSQSEANWLTHRVHMFAALRALKAEGFEVQVDHLELGPVRCYKNGSLEVTFEKSIHFVYWVKRFFGVPTE